MQYTQRQINALARVQETVKDFGPKEIASELNVSLGTVYADVDPNSIGRRTNKLGFLDYYKVLDISGDLTSLEGLCADFNLLCLPLPDTSIDLRNWLLMCAAMAKEGAEATTAVVSAVEDGKWERDELVECEKECLDALKTIGSAYVTIKAMLDKRNESANV